MNFGFNGGEKCSISENLADNITYFKSLHPVIKNNKNACNQHFLLRRFSLWEHKEKIVELITSSL